MCQRGGALIPSDISTLQTADGLFGELEAKALSIRLGKRAYNDSVFGYLRGFRERFREKTSHL